MHTERLRKLYVDVRRNFCITQNEQRERCKIRFSRLQRVHLFPPQTVIWCRYLSHSPLSVIPTFAFTARLFPLSPLIPLSCLFYRDPSSPSPRCFHFHTISSRSSTSHHHATPIVSALLSRCICRTMNARNVDAIDEITCFPVAHYYGLQIMCILRSPSLTARGERIGSAPIFYIHPALLCLQYQLKTKVARECDESLAVGRRRKYIAEASTCTAAIRRLIFISTFDRTWPYF